MDKVIAREIIFPDIRSFSDIFPTAFPKGTPEAVAVEPHVWEFEDLRFPKRGNGPMRAYKERINIGPYICFGLRNGRYVSGAARCSDAVADYIRDNMLPAGVNDYINFKAVERTDGVLLIAENSQIIGQRWLALVDLETLPTWARESSK